MVVYCQLDPIARFYAGQRKVIMGLAIAYMVLVMLCVFIQARAAGPAAVQQRGALDVSKIIEDWEYFRAPWIIRFVSNVLQGVLDNDTLPTT